MADKDFFPGFAGEDEKPKAKPQPPAAKPGFDPFAGTEVKPPAPGTAPPPPAAPAPAPTADGGDDQPAPRKDLWKCPHCGAGNKPDRNECRACGKGRDEPVTVPWHRNNLIRAAIGAVVVAAIVLLVLSGGADLTLREPGPEAVDQRPRIGGSSDASGSVSGGVRFTGSKLISVSGRVVAAKQSHGLTWIALALGPAARDDDAFAALAATPSGAGYEFSGGCVLACIFSTQPTFEPGTWLSLSGSTGDLVKEARLLRETEGAIVVKVDDFRVLKP